MNSNAFSWKPLKSIRLPSSLKPNYTTTWISTRLDAVDLLVKLRPFVGDRNISPNDFKQVRTVGDLVKVLDHILND